MDSFFYYTVLTLLVAVAVLLILLILIQKGRGGGLSGAFGGGGGGSSAFGAKTGDVLTWATSIGFGIFIVLAVALDLVVQHQYKSPLETAATPAVPVSNQPDNSMPTDQTSPALPATTAPTASSASGISSLNDLKTSATSATQSAGNSVQQLVKQATTQASGAINAATQPAGKLLNGLK